MLRCRIAATLAIARNGAPAAAPSTRSAFVFRGRMRSEPLDIPSIWIEMAGFFPSAAFMLTP